MIGCVMAAHMRALFPEGPLDSNAASGRAILEQRQIYLRADTPRTDGLRIPGNATGILSSVATPLIREGQAIGVLMVLRSDPRPFTEADLGQLANFASQAVIAIENARLLNELRQRTDDLTESLEQQTATSEVLKVISSSPGELDPVFNAMLDNAVRICDAKFGVMLLYDGSGFHPRARLGAPPALVEHHRQNPSFRPDPGSFLDVLIKTKEPVHIADDAASPQPGGPAQLAGARSTLSVPMLKENDLIGAFTIYRQEVRPFTDKQIALVQNFAAQAVIAIENARLLNELRQRTDDLSESLEQQTATSQVLGVISSSLGELQPIFQTILDNATRLCGAHFGALNLYDGKVFRIVALHNVPKAYVHWSEGTMIFYLARGPLGACGPNCSEWIAAEGTVQWDTYKRLLALLDRLGNREPPVIFKGRGEGDLKVATAIGRIIRKRGLDVSAGSTVVSQCASTTEAECFGLKRSGGPLAARIDSSSVECDLACVLMFAGGVERTLPADSKVVINSAQVRNRLGTSVSAEHQEGLKAYYSQQFRLYLTQMGVRPELVDIIDRNSDLGRATRLSPNECLRLGLVTALAL